MTLAHSENLTAEEQIIQLVKRENPENIQQLIKLVKDKLALSEKEALNHVIQLVNQQKIRLKEPSKPTSSALSTYVRSGDAYWFWTTIILAAFTATAVFTIPEDAYPIVYIRYVLGTLFVLFLPGYTLMRAMFPPKKEIDQIERTALSIGSSLAIVPMIGLLLNYTPWGIRLTPITISLLALTTTFATIAIIREYQNKTNDTQKTSKIERIVL